MKWLNPDNKTVCFLCGITEKKLFYTGLLLILAVYVQFYTGCGLTGAKEAVSAEAEKRPVMLYSGGGVRGPVSECVSEFEKLTGISVETVFGHSGRMFEQACSKNGDIYIAGDIKYIDDAEKQGHVLARKTLCWAVPVIAVARSNPKKIRDVRDLGRPGVRFYLVGAQQCQLGILGEQLLAAGGVTSAARDANRMAELSKGKKLPEMLANGDLDAAIVWKRSCGRMGKGIEILELPALNKAACPLAAVILRGNCTGDAGKLLSFLTGEQGRSIFTKHGCTVQKPGRDGPSAIEKPDYVRFGRKGAARFNNVAKKRSIVYSRLAEYLVDRFKIAERPGIGIDIGSGPGDLIVELASRTKQFYWINADINTWYAQFFYRDAAEKGAAHRTGFIFADACAMPFREGYADLVVSRGCYQFWPDLESGLREVFRVLRPGGEAFIGRGFPPTMPEKEARMLIQKKLVGGPKYDREEDAARFRNIMKKMGITMYEVILHCPEDKTLNYGVWLYLRK